MSNIVVYRGSRMQRGSGLGDLLRKALRKFAPVALDLGKTAARKVGGIAKEAAIQGGTAAANKLIQKATAKAKQLSKSPNIGKAAVGSAALSAMGNVSKGIKRKAIDGPPQTTIKKAKKSKKRKGKSKKRKASQLTYLDN